MSETTKLPVRPKPNVKWLDSELNEMQDWNIPTTDAGNDPEDREFTFYIWNNKKEDGEDKVDLPDMVNCRIRTVDVSGSISSEPVKFKWVESQCVSRGETGWQKIGSDPDGNGGYVEVSHPISTAAYGAIGEGVIKGSSNDGLLSDTTNYAKVKLRLNVPPEASPGVHTFITRVYYEVAE